MRVTNNLLRPAEIGFWKKSISYTRDQNVEIINIVGRGGKQYTK